MKIYSQRDPKWGKDKMGKSGLELEDYGCLCTSIAMIDGRTPKEINTIFSENGAYNQNGILNHEIASHLLGLNFGGFSSTPQGFPTIAEVDMSPSPGRQQHFVVQESEESILDPWTGTRRSHKTYPIISYRLYTKEESMKLDKKFQDELEKYGMKKPWKELQEKNLPELKEMMSSMRNQRNANKETLDLVRKEMEKSLATIEKYKQERDNSIQTLNDFVQFSQNSEKERVAEKETVAIIQKANLELADSLDQSKKEIDRLTALVERNAKDTSILDALSFAIKAILNR